MSYNTNTTNTNNPQQQPPVSSYSSLAGAVGDAYTPRRGSKPDRSLSTRASMSTLKMEPDDDDERLYFDPHARMPGYPDAQVAMEINPSTYPLTPSGHPYPGPYVPGSAPADTWNSDMALGHPSLQQGSSQSHQQWQQWQQQQHQMHHPHAPAPGQPLHYPPNMAPQMSYPSPHQPPVPGAHYSQTPRQGAYSAPSQYHGPNPHQPPSSFRAGGHPALRQRHSMDSHMLSPASNASPYPPQHATTSQNATGRGPKIPQKEFATHYGIITPPPPISFNIENYDRPGVPMRLLKTVTLVGHKDAVLPVDIPATFTLRIWWPGYEPYARRITSRKNYGSLHRIDVAKTIAETFRFFIDEQYRHPRNENKRWQVGPEGISVDDLVLLNIRQVSQGSWQAEVELEYEK